MPTKTPRDEHKWQKAKEIAADAGRAEDYAYITGIYKKMRPDYQFKNKQAGENLVALQSKRGTDLNDFNVGDQVRLTHAAEADVFRFFRGQPPVRNPGRRPWRVVGLVRGKVIAQLPPMKLTFSPYDLIPASMAARVASRWLRAAGTTETLVKAADDKAAEAAQAARATYATLVAVVTKAKVAWAEAKATYAGTGAAAAQADAYKRVAAAVIAVTSAKAAVAATEDVVEAVFKVTEIFQTEDEAGIIDWSGGVKR